jgi:predicted nucleic acid-binding protein
MPEDKAFFDTNVVAYAFSAGDRRQRVALDLLVVGGTVGVQTLNEFVRVVISRLKRPWSDAIAWLETIEELCEPAVPMTLSVHRKGLRIAQTYGYQLYDSMMLAAALEASCTVFYSEDMQDGQTIGDMTIRNPFKS